MRINAEASVRRQFCIPFGASVDTGMFVTKQAVWYWCQQLRRGSKQAADFMPSRAELVSVFASLRPRPKRRWVSKRWIVASEILSDSSTQRSKLLSLTTEDFQKALSRSLLVTFPTEPKYMAGEASAGN